MQITLLGLTAILVFWMVGGYNRLVSLRNALGAAVAQIDEGLTRRAVAVEPLCGALREPLADEAGALEALRAAHGALQAASSALRARPSEPAVAQAWLRSEAAWSAALSRVRALVEQHPAVASRADVAPQLQVLADADARIGFARQLFNDAAMAYDDALALFPTSVLAWIYGFGAAGRL